MAEIQKKKSFCHKMLASGESDTVSHKRVVSIVSLVMLCLLAIASALGYSATKDFIYVFGILTGGESLLTVIEKTKGMVNRINHVMVGTEQQED